MIESIAREGFYKSQFETGTSNGELTALAEGDRWKWENSIFGGAYDNADPALQPKSGALNFRQSVIGGSTCLVQYASNRHSVPSRFAGQHVSLRAYAGRIVLVSGQDVIAEHKQHFTRNVSYFESWHYVPLFDRKPGALRDGAPFVGWQLPGAMHRIRGHDMSGKGGGREFVDLLLLA